MQYNCNAFAASAPQDMSEIAEATDGFSGADMNILVRQAIMEPVRKCKNATHFKTVMVRPGDTARSVPRWDSFLLSRVS